MSQAKRIPLTHFAPAKRVPIAIIHRQAAAFGATPLTSTLLDSVLNRAFILNRQRQIVFASRNMRQLVPGKQRKGWLGLRLGEALGCIHAGECAGGCGTAVACRECGAAQAILNSLAGQRDLREYRLTRFIGCREERLDLLVMAMPLKHDRKVFSLIAICDAKSRPAAERLFAQDFTLAERPPKGKRASPGATEG